MVALDCYTYGVIPIVYHRGGMTHIIEHGKNGFCFADLDELKKIMELLDKRVGGSFHRRMFTNCQQQAESYSFPAFKDQIENYLRREMVL